MFLGRRFDTARDGCIEQLLRGTEVSSTFRLASLVVILLATLRTGAVAAQPTTMAQAAKPAELGSVAWQTDVESAWSATRSNGRPLLVFVTRSHCAFCVQMKDRTYGNVAVAGAINRSFVPLVLDGGTTSPLLKELHVSVYPSTFVISPQAVILARIDGYVPPEAMAQRSSGAGAKIRRRQLDAKPLTDRDGRPSGSRRARAS